MGADTDTGTVPDRGYERYLRFSAQIVLSDKLDDAIGAFDRNAFTRPDTTDFFSGWGRVKVAIAATSRGLGSG